MSYFAYKCVNELFTQLQDAPILKTTPEKLKYEQEQKNFCFKQKEKEVIYRLKIHIIKKNTKVLIL